MHVGKPTTNLCVRGLLWVSRHTHCTYAELVDGTKLFDFINTQVKRAIMIHTGIEKEVIIPYNQTVDKCNILMEGCTAPQTRYM